MPFGGHEVCVRKDRLVLVTALTENGESGLVVVAKVLQTMATTSMDQPKKRERACCL